MEFEANNITTFTTVKKITRTMKTENMSDFDDTLAKIKELKEKTTKALGNYKNRNYANYDGTYHSTDRDDNAL